MKKLKNKVFWIRLKPFEPGAKNVKYSPCIIKGLAYAPNAERAKKLAYDQHISFLRALFPTADLKVVECKHLNADFSITAQ